ncbi:hypothetical protein TNCV_345791 [Trichonephila clavipes]|nr:hypothetical protein TNCV_345791 [Trichonephila clavipes]
MSASSTAASISEIRTPIPTSIPVPPSTASRDQTSFSAPAKSQDVKENSKRKKRKNPVKIINQPEIEIKLAPHKPRKFTNTRFLRRRYHRPRQCQFKLISGPECRRSTGSLGTGRSKENLVKSSLSRPLGGSPKIPMDKPALSLGLIP